MDKRMYRGNMGNNNGRRVPPYRQSSPVCNDMGRDYRPEERCNEDSCHDDCFTNNKNCPIGMCYVPWQCFRDIYDNEFHALENGTLFKELQFDWHGRGC